MRILVTGGTGFIGSHLCKKFINEGHSVICMDNLFTGPLDNVKDIMDNERFTFINHDVTVPIYLKGDIDQIYHLACPASPKAYQFNPVKTITTCTTGTTNILEIAKRKNARILLTSTSEVYGDPTVSPQREDYRGNVNTLGIRACYDEGKRISETLFMEYHRMFKVDIRIARIFNTYGPYMSPDDGRVVSNFIVQCINNKNITMYGEGNQTRSFCYVDDTVEGLVALMNGEEIGPINIGNPNEITVLELATQIKTMLPDSTSEIVYVDLPQDDPKQRRPDITKANECLGWWPRVSLAEGLSRTVEYFSKPGHHPYYL